MKLIINIKCYCEFVICFYFCSGLTEHKNERKRKRQDFYSMAVVNDAYAIFHGRLFTTMKKMPFAILIVGILMIPLISVPCAISHFHLLHKLKHYNFILFFRFLIISRK